MDDGGIIGSPELLLKVWDILKTDGPPLGLILNPAKCEWSWLNSECALPCPLEQVTLVPTDEIQMLGVPLGSDASVSSFVEGKLCRHCQGDGKVGGVRRPSSCDVPSAAVLRHCARQSLHAHHSSASMVCSS